MPVSKSAARRVNRLVMARRYETIQALRGIAALLVFGAHLAGAEGDYGGGRVLLPAAAQIGLTGVDLFFLISGFVMVHVARGGAQGPRGAARFLVNRAGRIYPLYWAVTIALLVLYAGKAYFFGEATAIANPVSSFLLAPQAGLPIVNVGWTLVHEMYFYAVFALFLIAPVQWLAPAIMLWTALVFAGHLSGLAAINPWTKVAFSPYTFEFIAGCAISFLIKAGATRLAWPAIFTGAGALAVVSATIFEPQYPDLLIDAGRRVLVFAPAYALILYGAAALETEGRLTSPRWLVALGDASYALYLVHIPVFLVVGKTLSLTGFQGPVYHAFLLAAFTSAALGVAFAAHHGFERPALKAAKSLTARMFSSPTKAAKSAAGA